MYWTEDEINLLKNSYSNMFNKDLSIVIGRSIRSIEYMANKISLKKDPDFIKRSIKNRNTKMNKLRGRDLNYNFLLECALKYKTKSEFMTKDISAYSSAVKKGIINKICNHMRPLNFSIPQMMLYELVNKFISESLYNERVIIKPYELDIYNPEFNIAFEYNGGYWHNENKNDELKLKITLEKDIKLFIFKENSRKYESDIKSQFIDILDEINSITGRNIKITDIENIDLKVVFDKILNFSDIEKVCNGYNDFNIFCKEQNPLYQRLIKFNILEKYTSHMKKRKRWIIESVIDEVKRYNTKKEFYTKSKGCYIFISRNKEYKYLLDNLI